MKVDTSTVVNLNVAKRGWDALCYTYTGTLKSELIWLF